MQQGSEIEVSYDPTYQKLAFHEVKIIRNGLVINKLDPAKFKVIQRESSKESYIYDGSLLALLILEDIRAGDQIEYSFSITGHNPIYGGRFASSFYLNTYEPVDVLSVRIISPVELQTKMLNTATAPAVTRENGQFLYHWYGEHLTAVTTDNDTPAWYNPYPQMMVSQYQSWEEVSQWALKNYTFPVKPAQGLTDQINKIRAEVSQPSERLEKALQFVQDEIRYTGLEAGIGGYKPRNPSVVFEQRFGDCKDKSLLLCYMLDALGVQASPALVSTTDRRAIVDQLPSPNAFNHCVVQVRMGGEVYWYDPTVSHQGGRFRNRYFGDLGYALVIKPDTRELTRIEPARISRTEVEEVFTLPDVGGPVELKVTSRYHGYEADQLRQSFAGANLKETGKSYLNYTAKTYPQLEVKESLRYEDDRQENIFTTYESYGITNFWTAPDTTRPGKLECSVYPQTLRDKLFVPSTKIRTAPFGLEYPLHYEHTIRFDLPEAWPIENKKEEIKGPGINFTSHVDYQREKLTLSYVYRTTQDHVDARSTAAFVKKQTEIINQLGYSLTYNQNAQATASGFRVNWLMVLLVLLFAGGTVWGALKVYNYDPEPAFTSGYKQEIGGWLYLFGFGLLVRPVLQLVRILSNNYFNWNHWEALTNQSSSSYNPLLATMLVTELLYNIVTMGLCCVLFLLFVRRRSSVPVLVMVLYAVSIAYVCLETYLLWDMNLLSEAEKRSGGIDVIKLIINAAIWIPYFRLSVRVKETFVETLRVPEDRQEIYRPNY